MPPQKTQSAKRPKLQNPPGIHSAIGSAEYQNGYYRVGATNDPINQANTASAAQGFNNYLQQSQNPQALADEQMGVYRNAMVPQFDFEQKQQLSNAKAGLGDRYASTFGQLNLSEAANQAARARAGLEKDIYDSGQTAIDRQLGRTNTMGQIANQAQTNQLQPYETLGSLMGTAGQNVGNYNQAQNSRYSTDVNLQVAQEKQQAEQNAAKKKMAIQAAAALANFIPGIGPIASAGISAAGSAF